MPSSADELVELLDLETIDVNLFRGRQPDTKRQRTFGGQVAAQAMVAAARTAPADRLIHSLHSYFLRPGDNAVPIVYDVDPVRDGRSFTTRRVVARQHGRPIYVMTASFQVEEDGLEHQDAMPDVPPPDRCADIATARGDDESVWDEWSALDLRHAGDSRPGGELSVAGRPAVSRFWVRVTGRLPDDALTHKAALTYASDMTLLATAMVPHGRRLSDPAVQAASLDHAVWFHRAFRADEWLLYDHVSPSASGGRGLAFGELFSQDGRLVATVAQEGLMRLRRELTTG